MTKDDKVFFTGLIKGLENRFDGLEGRFDGLEGRFDKLEGKVEENSRGIRYNGMLIEKMQDDITLIHEGDANMQQMGAKVDEIYEIVKRDIPAIKRVVSDHSRRITALESKCG